MSSVTIRLVGVATRFSWTRLASKWRRHWTASFRLARGSAFVLAACVVLASCGPPSEKDLISSAKALMQDKKNSAAIIQLKSALQQNPQSSEARYLLGKVLLRTGAASYAIVELDKATKLQYNNAEVLPVLARALMATGQTKKVTDLYGEVQFDDVQALAELKAVVATAYALQGQADRSEVVLNAALRLDPSNSNARLLQARLTAGRGQFEQALSLVDSLLRDDPQNGDAWYFKGELLLRDNRADQAAQAFRRTIAVDPKFLTAHISLINMSLRNRDFPAFRTQLKQMEAALPGQPDTRYFEVQAALLDKDIKKAREVTQRLLQAAPDNPRLLELSGVVELAGGSLVLAENNLAKAIQTRPGLTTARRLLAQTYLRSGQPSRAIATLQPLLDQSPDAAALALVAEAYLQSGQLQESESYFVKAAKYTPDDLRIQTALALAQIAKGNAESGLSALEEMAAKDQSAYSDLALITARLRRTDFSSALKDVDRLQAKLPNSALPHYLRGQIQVQLKDVAGARVSYEMAVTADPNYFPAIVRLSTLDLEAGRNAQAISRLEALLAREPKSFRAIVAIADIKQRRGASAAEVTNLLQTAIKVAPEEVLPRVLLVDHLLVRREAKAALAAAQEALIALPDNPQILDALGGAQLASGQIQQAISTFTKGVTTQPGGVAAHFKLAQAHLANKDAPAAQRSLNRVLEIDPKSLAAQNALIQLAVADKRPNEALSIARVVQTQRPGEAAGYLLEADVLVSQRRWQPALEAMRTALDRQRSTAIALHLHAILLAAGKNGDAERFAEAWLREHAKDIAFLSYLGAIELDQHRFLEAENRFRSVLAIDANNVNALNNVAWAITQQGKKGAIPFARKANEMAPDRPAMLDTLAAATAAEGDLTRAIQLQRTALEKSGGGPDYRFQLAKLLIKSGDRDGARKELAALSQLGDKFPRQAEANKLLQSL